eukprot:TRINITY_DN8601_c0_g1_i11.p1 TRINITY_DN8601_c0_g1~~TRINITY_DN8601_c0_g1_i11.p1  ORF type:complete len:769 (+),score=198.98 TRINITY_DN8601_c0_g1_i11:62-2368(+)
MFPNKTKAKKGADTKPPETFEKEWQKMEDSFNELLTFIEGGMLTPDPGHYKRSMGAYAVVYNICTKHEGAKMGVNFAAELYKRAKSLVEKHLEEKVTKQVIQKTGDALLQEVHKEWRTHALIVKWTRFMFKYLDDYYTKSPIIDTLTIMMLKCFHSAVFDKIKDNLRHVILANIESERDGNTINKEVLRSAIWLFIDMGMNTCDVYDEELEKVLIKQTKQYYKKESVKWMAEEGGQHTYLKRAEARINEESRRADSILAPTTKGPLLKALDDELLAPHIETCLKCPDAGCEALLQSERNEGLGRMFRLFSRVEGGLDQMAGIVKDHIEKEGKLLNSKFSTGSAGESGEAASTTYIKSCLTLHDKYTVLFEESLSKHEVFTKARKAAFEVFINPQQSDSWALKQKSKDGMEIVTTSELLSTYIDSIIKKEMESEEQLDAILEKSVTLFTYIHDKDLFQQFYMKQMSRRLMHNKNQRLLDQERSQIGKLKMKMGSAFTSKLEGMLADQSHADDHNRRFKQHLTSNQEAKLPIDFTPMVLTTGFWPAFKHDQLVPPEEMKICLEQYEKYYAKATQSRKLTWIHSLGHATVSKKFAKGPRDMSVTTYQACVLVLFNATGSVLVKEAQETLSLPFEEIKRTIHSLAYGKYPVIKRADGAKVKQVKETDQFVINEEFHTNSRKFKIPAVVKQERESITDTNQEQRRHVIEACIVRIMKSRRTLSHNDLVTETIKQLSHLFSPDMRIIKKRIEDLIQRQYLERDEQNRNQYRYLA